MTSGMALPAAAALFCPSPRSVPGIPASPGGGRAIIGHEMSGTDSPETPPRPLAADVALPDLASGKPAPEKEPLRLSDLLVRRLRACLSRGIGPPAARAWGEERPRLEPPGMYRARFLDAIWCSPRFSGSSVAASSSSSPTTDPPSPDIVPTAGSPCESIVTSGFSSFPLPLTSSESDVSRDEFPSPVTPLRSSSRSPLAVLGLHGSSESRRRPSHTPPCASSSACAARVPWSLEPEPPPSRRRMPPAILFPRRSPPPPPLSPFDSPRAVAGAVSPPSPSASRLPRSSAPPSALGTPDINPSLGVHAAASPAVGRPSSSAPSCLSTFLGGWPARSSGQSAGEQIIARAFSRGALHFSAGEAPGGSSEDVLERGAEFEIRRSDPRAWNRALGASPRARRDEGRRSRSSSGLRGGRVG